MMIILNPLETNRFGVGCARLAVPVADDENLAMADREAATQGVAMLTARVDVGALSQVHALERAGYRLMDTLVWYGRGLERSSLPVHPGHGLVLRRAEASDEDVVGGIAERAFASYLGHYHADPRLDRAAADAAYVEWARRSVAAASPLAPVMLAELDGDVAGFATMRFNTPDEAEIVLNAVDPLRKGAGVYTALVAAALHLAAENGAGRLIVSTQINNYTVQRVWARLGFCHERSVYTFHKWLV